MREDASQTGTPQAGGDHSADERSEYGYCYSPEQKQRPEGDSRYEAESFGGNDDQCSQDDSESQDQGPHGAIIVVDLTVSSANARAFLM